RLGKTYGNLMVSLDPANEKLQARARTIVAQATGAANGEVEEALAAAGGDAKVAIVSLLTGLDAAAAAAKLAEADGVVRRALEAQWGLASEPRSSTGSSYSATSRSRTA